MPKITTFLELCFAMKMGVVIELNGLKGTISSIQKEDGSGKGWNVTFQGGSTTFFREA